jgi:hypothetical protein
MVPIPSGPSASAEGHKPHKGKAIVAGALAGIVEICCTVRCCVICLFNFLTLSDAAQYPTEYVKTTMQLSTHKLTVTGVVTDTIRGSSGFSGLYRGLSSMVYFAGPKAGIRFAAFEAANTALSDEKGNDIYRLGAARGFIAGLVAGSLEAIFVTTPQETIKIKLINDMFRSDGRPPRYRNFFHGVKTIIAEEGFNGVYRGVLPTVLKVSTAQVCTFICFWRLHVTCGL